MLKSGDYAMIVERGVELPEHAKQTLGWCVKITGPLMLRKTERYPEGLVCYECSSHGYKLMIEPDSLMPLGDPQSAPDFRYPRIDAVVAAKSLASIVNWKHRRALEYKPPKPWL